MMMMSLSAKPVFGVPAARATRAQRPVARSCRTVTRAGLFKVSIDRFMSFLTQLQESAAAA